MSETNINLKIYTERNMIQKNRVDEEVRCIFVINPSAGPRTNERPGVDMVFLLDSSGSMHEKFYDSGKSKKEVVVEAAKKAATFLTNKDTISAISFNTEAVLILDHEKNSATKKIEQSMDQIFDHNGVTNFEEAMKLAEIVCKNKKNSSAKIVFLTDGNEYGGTPGKALEIAKNIIKQGVTIDAMGIGSDFNFDIMRNYSSLSGGITENIVALDKAQTTFKNILRTGQNAVAVNGHINILFKEGVRDVRVYQTKPEKRLLSENITTSGKGTLAQINIGDISNGASKMFAISCKIDTPDNPNIQVADISTSYVDISKGVNNTQNIKWHISLSDNSGSEMNDGFVTDCFREIELLIDYENAIKDYNNNNIKEAVKRLTRMIDNARSLGYNDEAVTYQKFLDKIANNEKLTQADINILSYTSSRGSRQNEKKESSVNKEFE